MRLNEVKASDLIDGYYILERAAIKINVKGEPFLAAEISDRTKTLPLKVWAYFEPTVDSRDNGSVVYVQGMASEYNGSIQVIGYEITKAGDSDNYDREELVPVAPIDRAAAFRRVTNAVASIRDRDYREVCRTILEKHRETFLTIPAAKSMHHRFIGGLLMHTSCMLAAAEDLADLYPGTINRDLLVAGVLLHDIAKGREFELSGLSLVCGYTVAGNLLGHLVMGAQEVAEVCKDLHVPEEKSILLQHLLLSHHGEPAYGAAVLPKTAEAELLHMIDMMDARMEMYRTAMEEMEPGTMSDRPVFGLDNKRIYKQSDSDALDHRITNPVHLLKPE